MFRGNVLLSVPMDLMLWLQLIYFKRKQLRFTLTSNAGFFILSYIRHAFLGVNSVLIFMAESQNAGVSIKIPVSMG